MSQFKKIPNKGLNLKPKPLNIHNIYKIKIHLPSLSCQIPLVKLFFSYARRDEVFFVVKNSLKV